MKLHSDDPRLTAYLLGELGPEETAAIGSAAASDPALQAELEEIRRIRDILSSIPAPAAGRLHPGQRTAILQAARQADLAGTTVPFGPRPGTWKRWLVPLSAAAAVTIGILAITRAPEKKSGIATSKESPRPVPQGVTAAQTPPPAVAAIEPPAIPPPARPISIPRPPGVATAAGNPSLELPVLSDKPDLAGITQAIRIERKLPARDHVRLEEILNRFPIRLTGVTAIARAPKPTWHPDNREQGLTTHTATLATETLPCPWKPSATLLLVSIRGNPATDAEAKLVFHPDQKTVLRYHLLGFNAAGESAGGPMPTKLAAGSATTLAIEIEPSTATGDLGSIEWSVNGEPATPVSIVRSGGNEPSDDARFAALACAWSLWLAGEPSGMTDPALLSALSREIDSPDLPADRADFLKLVAESLHL